MTIAVASGKGGTGKTTVSLALAQVLAQHGDVCLADCDVEEPNVHLFFPGIEAATITEFRAVPRIDRKLCDGCGICVAACQFNALARTGRGAMVFPELCHSCGRCVRLCPRQAMIEGPEAIGTISQSRHGQLNLVWGTLAIGQAMASPLIRAVQDRVPETGWTVLDCPPGTSCSMIQAVRESDLVVLVGEASAFGLHDLGLALATVKELGLPWVIVMNKSGEHDSVVDAWCRDQQVTIDLKIPHRRAIAEAIARGEGLLDAAPELMLEMAMFLGRLKKVAPNTGAPHA